MFTFCLILLYNKYSVCLTFFPSTTQSQVCERDCCSQWHERLVCVKDVQTGQQVFLAATSSSRRDDVTLSVCLSACLSACLSPYLFSCQLCTLALFTFESLQHLHFSKLALFNTCTFQHLHLATLATTWAKY